MFQHIRKHQKWLWIFISGAVIISFVWYFNPNQQYGGAPAGGNTDTVGVMYGEPVTLQEFNNARAEAVLNYLFNYGSWPEDNEVTRQLRPIESGTRSRLMLAKKVDDYNIEVTDKAVADWIEQTFQDRETKRFHKEVYDQFISQLPSHGLREADFLRFARHQLGIQHLAAVAGIPGKLVTPQQAEAQYREEHQKADTKLVLFSASNYLAKVETTPEKIGQFYTNRASSYRLPERVQLSYVAFPASNYLAQAEQKLAGDTNLAGRIDLLYAQRGPNFYTDENDQPLSPEAAKANIRKEALDELAKIEARRDAIAFATALIEMPTQPNSTNPAVNLENLATAQGLPVKVTKPFSQMEGPSDMNVPAQFARMAFSLSPDQPIIEEPVVGDDAVYVIAFKQRVPSELQPLDAITAQVTEDYRRIESQRLARENGAQFARSVTNALQSGKTFEQAAQEAGLAVTDVPPVSRDDRMVEGLPPQVDAGSVSATAFDLQEGKASGFVPSRDGGFVLFLEKIIPADEQQMKQELPTYVQDLRRQSAGQAFDSWFQQEMEVAQLRLATDEQETTTTQ